MAKKLTKKQIEGVAKEIRQFLMDHEMWQDVRIYFNGKAFSTDDGNGRYFYNDPNNLVVLEDVEPGRYVEYVGEVLTMTFEGPFYEVMNWGPWGVYEKFNALLKKHGLYGELGHAWSLGVFYI